MITKNKKTLIKHLVVISIILFFFIFAILQSLKIYTKHGEEYIVEDYTGISFYEIINNNSNEFFEFVLIDSVFDNSKIKGTVVSQSPSPGRKVKEGRKIYLTVVASQPEMVMCPNLEDLTIRQAITVLETYAINIGKIEYVPDIGNTIISWKQMGRNLSPSDKIIKGSKIDLVVGIGHTEEALFLPDLTGKTREEARGILISNGLIIGAEIFLNNRDTNIVEVVKQDPPYQEDKEIPFGSIIDLWFE